VEKIGAGSHVWMTADGRAVGRSKPIEREDLVSTEDRRRRIGFLHGQREHLCVDSRPSTAKLRDNPKVRPTRRWCSCRDTPYRPCSCAPLGRDVPGGSEWFKICARR
jgi:hypothetical protein